MIIKVKIEDQVYEVEIDDVRKRPIIAVVDGEEFEVWPEGEPTVHTKSQAAQYESPKQVLPLTSETLSKPVAEPAQAPGVNPPDTQPYQPANGSLLVVRAPIPGVITAVNIHAGEEVAVGQQLCVLEAMKMNNSIRASRAGRIAAVHITVGQHVKHHDILLEYAS
jgi:glutaconyl-CoA/methylmalonyl-CoA decarboxylase subunit gamma